MQVVTALRLISLAINAFALYGRSLEDGAFGSHTDLFDYSDLLFPLRVLRFLRDTPLLLADAAERESTQAPKVLDHA